MLQSHLIFLIVYFALNLIAFLMFVIDKKKAVKEKWRISEKSLIIISFFGPFGATIGMLWVRHKTRKIKFKLVYLFAIIHLTLWIYALIKYLG